MLSACGGGSDPDDTGSGPNDNPTEEPGGDPQIPPTSTGDPTAPVQAASGPGGSQASYASATSRYYGFGGTAYTLVVPDGAGSARLPVVYLLHGYGTLDIRPYSSWAEHLARRGAIVIYPFYQVLVTTPMDAYTPNAVQAIKDALERIAGDGGVRADTSKVIVIGHSLGGAVAANIAAVAAASGIPQPVAMMTINPSNQSSGGGVAMPMEDLGQVPANTLQLSLFSDQDERIDDAIAKQIFYDTSNIKAANKDYIVVNSDSHGDTPLVADHFAALAARASDSALYPPDALDFYGYWKLADALMSAAFYGDVASRNVALGHGSAAQRYMGTWGDGVEVKPLTVIAAP